MVKPADAHRARLKEWKIAACVLTRLESSDQLAALRLDLVGAGRDGDTDRQHR